MSTVRPANEPICLPVPAQSPARGPRNALPARVLHTISHDQADVGGRDAAIVADERSSIMCALASRRTF